MLNRRLLTTTDNKVNQFIQKKRETLHTLVLYLLKLCRFPYKLFIYGKIPNFGHFFMENKLF